MEITFRGWVHRPRHSLQANALTSSETPSTQVWGIPNNSKNVGAVRAFSATWVTVQHPCSPTRGAAFHRDTNTLLGTKKGRNNISRRD